MSGHGPVRPAWQVTLVALVATLVTWVLACQSLSRDGAWLLLMIFAPAGTFLGYWFGGMPRRGLVLWLLVDLSGVAGFQWGQHVPGTSYMFADLFAAVLYAGLSAILANLLALVALPIAVRRRHSPASHATPASGGAPRVTRSTFRS